MKHSIERVAVLGAGTMGAAIAAHAANAGLSVLLLDIAPRGDGDAPESKTVDKNQIVRQGLSRITKLKPASFASEAAQSRVEIGNFDDDFHRLADCDWIVEVVIERLDIKRSLHERIEGVRAEHALVTTNTSGLPIADIVRGRSEGFRRHFFGTHFFNPPRYMKLLEVIRGEDTADEAIDDFVHFARVRLGKGVVFTKDTPNFIGNRILSVTGSYTAAVTFDDGYRFEEVDALTGPLMGRPKTASFRLQDLVGIDIARGVAENLHGLIPDDEFRDAIAHERAGEVMAGLLSRGFLGNKSGQGFYKKSRGADGKSQFLVLDPETFEYVPQQDVDFESVRELSSVRDLGERLRGFFDPRWDDDRGAQLVRKLTAHFLAYSALRAPEIAFDLPSIDQAIRWGFSYESGPFEQWDAMGVEDTARAITEMGLPLAPWVREMLDAGHDTFYRYEDDRAVAYYDWESGDYQPLVRAEGHLEVDDLRRGAEPVATNRSASLHEMPGGVLLLEFHSKANAIDGGVVEMIGRAREELDRDDVVGMVIGNDGKNFCVGADLTGVGQLAMQGDWDGVAEATKALQHGLAGLRAHRKPVVAAVHGMALGGGAEVAMGVDRIVAHLESYVGLVEAGVGLVPAGGGLKELVRRVVDPVASMKNVDPLPAIQKAFETVAMAKVSTSSEEAREMGFLSEEDRTVMHRELLLSEARREVLAMAETGYHPPAPRDLWAGGRELSSVLEIGVWSLVQAGWASEHDAAIAAKVAHILAGGDHSAPTRLPEEHFLRLEREAFVDLIQNEKTQARMRHMLETGKPLRN